MPYVVPINIKHYFCNLAKCSVIFFAQLTETQHYHDNKSHYFFSEFSAGF